MSSVIRGGIPYRCIASMIRRRVVRFVRESILPSSLDLSDPSFELHPPRLSVQFGKKASKEPVSAFKETPIAETRRIRTRPRRIDYSNVVKSIKKSTSWTSKKPPVFTKHTIPPTFNPYAKSTDELGIDFECLPDNFEWRKPVTDPADRLDFSILPSTDPNNMSREAKALRWTEENVPLRDEDLPIALRNPEIRKRVLEQALGPNARPKDFVKLWNMKPPRPKDIDPWLDEQIKKLPIVDGYPTELVKLIAHPRTLRAAWEYLKIIRPSTLAPYYSPRFFKELSEKVLSGRYKPEFEVPDPPNPYRMHEHENDQKKKTEDGS